MLAAPCIRLGVYTALICAHISSRVRDRIGRLVEVRDGRVIFVGEGGPDGGDVGVGHRRVAAQLLECGKSGTVGGFGPELGAGQHARRSRRLVW